MTSLAPAVSNQTNDEDNAPLLSAEDLYRENVCPNCKSGREERGQLGSIRMSVFQCSRCKSNFRSHLVKTPPKYCLACTDPEEICQICGGPKLLSEKNAPQPPGAGGQNGHACALCGHAGAINRCSRCKVVYYCNAACQKTHWKTHKPNCGTNSNATTTSTSAATTTAAAPAAAVESMDIDSVNNIGDIAANNLNSYNNNFNFQSNDVATRISAEM